MFEFVRKMIVRHVSTSASYLAVIVLASIFSIATVAQPVSPAEYKSQEISDVDGVPVLLKNLPEWETRRDSARLFSSDVELRAFLGGSPVANSIEFSPGSEAAVADYEAGKLVIVEHPSPQASGEADQKLTAAIASANDGRTYHKRIGNYNVLVFDAKGSWAANSLMDQVKYEKQITWLGNNPFAISAERAFVLTTSDIFMSTLWVIVGGIVFSIFGGLVVGFVFFTRQDRRRAGRAAFTDGGGMTRLNLDGFTADVLNDRLLND